MPQTNKVESIVTNMIHAIKSLTLKDKMLFMVTIYIGLFYLMSALIVSREAHLGANTEKLLNKILYEQRIVIHDVPARRCCCSSSSANTTK